MRNGKRTLALVLTTSMLLGSLGLTSLAAGEAPAGGPPPPAQKTGAATMQAFQDLSQVVNQDSVDMMVALGIINGVDGAEGTFFQPTALIDRGSMAKMMAQAVTLVSGEAIAAPAALPGPGGPGGALQPKFSDIAEHWAADAITFCGEKGIIDGSGQGTFLPQNTVTGVETAKMLLTAMGVSNLTGEAWQDATITAASAQGLLAGLTADMNAPISRDNAAKMLANALLASDGKGVLPAVRYYTAGVQSQSLTIPPNTKLVAPSNKTLTLTVNGVETRPVAGTYTGDVVLTVADRFVLSNMGMDSVIRTGAYIKDGKVDEAIGVAAAIQGGTLTGDAAVGVTINSQNDEFNGIVVDGDTEYTIKDITIDMNGHGKDDFAGASAGITALGNAKVTVDNAKITTQGAIRTGIWAGGNAQLVVKNSNIVGKDGDDLNFKFSMMNEVPWILGLKGNLRSTIVLGAAKATYVNSYVASENWGALSTDSNSAGATLTAINTEMVVTGESGYAAYADQKVQTYFYGSLMKTPAIGLIVAAGDCGAVFGKSSQENTGAFYADLAKADQDKVTTVEAGTNAVMWHKNQGGTVHVKEGTVLNTGETTFLIKSDTANPAAPILKVDSGVINSKSGVVLHLAESDDAGMNPNGGGPGSATMWADGYTVPKNTTPVADETNPTVAGANTVQASFSNMTVNGDIYNSRFTAGQNLALTLENVKLKGVVSAGIQSHTFLAPGQTIGKADYDKLGRFTVAPAPAACNGVILNLDAKSTWTVTGTSYLTSLTAAKAASIQPAAGRLVVTVDDELVTLEDGKTYTGTIRVSTTATTMTVMGHKAIAEDMTLTALTLDKGATLTAPTGREVTMVVNGKEMAIEGGKTYTGQVELVVTGYIGQIGSFAGGDADDYDFRTALYITDKGIWPCKSVQSAIAGGAVTAKEISGITINSTSDNFNGIIVNGETDLTVKDSKFHFISKSDGSAVNDFSGYGAVISAFNGAKVTLDNVDIKTEGVARLASFTDEYAHTLFKNSKIDVKGGTLYQGYQNTADQGKMVAPPWVLGIAGNARGTNLEGNLSSTTVYNSDMRASEWGVISTDAGKDMLLNLVDSTLTLTKVNKDDPFSTNYGTGYATYAIGDAREYFRGVTMNVGTYATIFTGGYGFFGASKAGVDHTTNTLARTPNGTKVVDFFGTESEGYDVSVTDNAVFTGLVGKGQKTVINSDAFGFMSHGPSEIVVTEGTQVNTDNAVFLFKVGDAKVEVSDGAQLNVKDGVILQMMDNDDALVGVTFPAGFNGPVFNTRYTETPGFAKATGSVSGNAPVVFTATDVALKGNFYNGSGNYAVTDMAGNTAATGNTLQMTLGKGVTLDGAISATGVMHIDETGKQIATFTMDEYYYLGHVANQNHFNGANAVEVTLQDGAVWNVTAAGILSSLTVGKGCTLNGTVTVDGVATVIVPGVTYTGSVVVSAK